MARSYFASFIAAALACASAFASFAVAVSTLVGDRILEAVCYAFPPTPRPPYEFAVAAAPRVTGLHQGRSFRQRIVQREGDSGLGRAPLSMAFVTT